MGLRPRAEARSRSESGDSRPHPSSWAGETPTPHALRHGNGPAGSATSGDRLRSRAPPAPARPASSPSGPLNNVQHQRMRPWSPGLNCPLCLRRHLPRTGDVGDPAGSPKLGGGTRQQSTRP
ncbi:uncharacterized protein LOC118909634 [Manis pentadactyla]|uniref:uncharacterized protein LOC118909634 n=1 Tax=Manis pentadactyla TaxID=143292 RepID=UPI00255C3B62|nr:uncharacterized protein LOC118909634 [Manis pentadactyla]